MANGTSNGLDADAFAKCIARFDIANPSEAEAMNAARALRRMVAREGLRFVDVMERADVKQALDAQLQPVREDSPELKEAFGKVAQLAEALAREKEITARLRTQLAAGPLGGTISGAGAMARAIGGWNEVIVIVVTGLGALLLVLGALRHDRAAAPRAASAATVVPVHRNVRRPARRRKKQAQPQWKWPDMPPAKKGG